MIVETSREFEPLIELPDQRSNFERIEANFRLGRRINAEVMANPLSPYAGKFVAIVDGNVVAVVDSMTDALHRVQAVQTDPTRNFCFEAGRPFEHAEEVWGSAG